MTIGRRELLLSMPGLALVSRLSGQATKPAIPVKAINYFALSVSDMKRSIDFYQGLFGMPVQGRQGSTVLLRIGNGPQFLALSPAGSNAPSIVSRMGIAVENFNADRLVGMLAPHGITAADASGPGLTGGAMKVRVTRRGPENGGAREGTPELFVGDPDDFVLQIQDATYAGGSGPLGNAVTVEASPKKGLIALKDLSHATIRVSDANRTQTFYQEVFGTPVRSRQATTPGLGIGPGVMFVMFIGGAGGRGRGGPGAPGAPGGAPPAGGPPAGGPQAGPRAGGPQAAAAGPVATPGASRARIDHISLNLENFKPEEVMKTLAEFGITERSGAGAAGPLKSYITLRMPDRGGAPGGTPELYFTDPDGLLLQLQDVRYCGGGGILGDVCLG